MKPRNQLQLILPFPLSSFSFFPTSRECGRIKYRNQNLKKIEVNCLSIWFRIGFKLSIYMVQNRLYGLKILRPIALLFCQVVEEFRNRNSSQIGCSLVSFNFWKLKFNCRMKLGDGQKRCSLYLKTSESVQLFLNTFFSL